MRINRALAATCLVAAIIAFCNESSLLAQQPASSGLTMAEFEKLHKELQPPDNELWRTIPWQVSILEGRALAAKTKKPIFVWVASGEPLGCGCNNVVAFRATAFNDPKVVDLLKKEFVCVGIAHNGAGRRKDAEGDFARIRVAGGDLTTPNSSPFGYGAQRPFMLALPGKVYVIWTNSRSCSSLLSVK